jgi:hypothetical protein
MKNEECMLLDCLKSLSVLVITTFSFAIIYIMTSQTSLRLSSTASSSIVMCCQH